MARSVDELLRLKGAVASGEFSSDGKVKVFRSKSNELSSEVADLTAQFAASVSQLLGTLAVAHSKISGFNWVPEQGWAYSGGPDDRRRRQSWCLCEDCRGRFQSIV